MSPEVKAENPGTRVEETGRGARAPDESGNFFSGLLGHRGGLLRAPRVQRGEAHLFFRRTASFPWS